MSGMEALLLKFCSSPNGLETWLQPLLICVVLLHRFYVIDSSLIVPTPTIPPTNTAPDIACMIFGMTRERCAVLEVVRPTLVAGTDDAIHILSAESGINLTHGP